MKIIFLDYDGVLNSPYFLLQKKDQSPTSDFDPKCIDILAKICSENLKQVVGHTPVEGISECNVNDSTIIFCDTFSTDSNLEPIGDGGLLEIEYDDGQLNYCAVQTTKYKLEVI